MGVPPIYPFYMLDLNDSGLLLLKWIPTALLAASFAVSLVFFMLMFILLRGFSRLSYLKDISLTLKRIEKLIEGKNKAS